MLGAALLPTSFTRDTAAASYGVEIQPTKEMDWATEIHVFSRIELCLVSILGLAYCQL